MQEGGEEPMTVDGGAADARKRNYSDACDGASEDDDRALEDMALAFGAGQGGDDEMSSSSSSSSDDEDFEYDYETEAKPEKAIKKARSTGCDIPHATP